MVIFEKRQCSDCTVFHQSVLSDADVRDTLAKFEVARFDIADTKTPVLSPSGQKIKPAQWYEKTGFTRVPAFLFFDEKGNEVLRTDALVLNQRLMNSLNFVLERAYEKGWTYQRFARTKGAERRRQQQATSN
jgi:thioredoxin-related protein